MYKIKDKLKQTKQKKLLTNKMRILYKCHIINRISSVIRSIYIYIYIKLVYICEHVRKKKKEKNERKVFAHDRLCMYVIRKER